MIMTPIIDCLKQKLFQWVKNNSSLKEMKKVLSSEPVLAMPDFEKQFQVQTDDLIKGIGAMLSQEGKPIAFFSEKLSSAKHKWNIYQHELYIIVRALNNKSIIFCIRILYY